MKQSRFELRDSKRGPWLIVSTEHVFKNIYVIKYNKPDLLGELRDWRNLFIAAKVDCEEKGAEQIRCRVRKNYDYEKIITILEILNFQKQSNRVEFQQQIDLLPRIEGSPIVWKTIKDLLWSADKLKQFLFEVIKDSFHESENIDEFIADWFIHEELTCGLDCISIGFIKEEPCSLVVAQVEKSSGWSRLSYMGILPQFRNKGYGKWVHRHGFSMMRDQGGVLYHGGTHLENEAMVKLFEQHGCKKVWEMEDWLYETK